jgi:hypothetical protein
LHGIFAVTLRRMSPTDVSLFSDRAQFDAAVRSRSWEWLLALRRRLTVDLQIVDDAQRALLQPTDPLAVAIEPLVASGAPGVRQALSTAVRTRTPQALSVESVLLVFFPLTMGRATDGALVLAKRTPEETPAERARGELELVGLWLSNAVEAHLTSPLAAEADLDRLSSLCRLLGGRLLANAAAEGSDRQIIAAFAETLAVWHDLDVYGYVETAAGDFVREVSLIGADPSASPAVIPRAALPEAVDVTRLSKADIERLGFPVFQDVVVTRLADTAGSWLLVVGGQIATYELTRISLYLALLDQTIGRAIDAAKARVVASIATHLLEGEEGVEEQARRALAELQQALGMSYAALNVTNAAGVPLVHLGSPPSETETPADGKQLVIVRRIPQQYTMTMAVGWAAERRVTRQEHQVAHASADLLESWVQRVARRTRHVGERRVASRSFDEMLDRFARQALEGGTPVTAVVLSFGDAVFRPGITQTRIGRIREQVRAADLVGRLSEGEIGMLLHDTPGGHANAVIARVRRVLQTVDDPASAVPMSIGIATRTPGEPIAVRVAQEAREAALRHANVS